MSEVNLAVKLDDTIGAIRNRSEDRTSEHPFIVNVCGPSASGKSTISREVAASLPDTSVIEMDRYLAEGLWDSSRVYNHDPPDPTKPYIGGISPEIWDMELMQSQAAALSQGESVMMPVFDETIKDRVGFEEFQATSRMILEGGHSFSEPFIDLAEYKILVDASLHDRLVRKLFRTCVTYGLAEGDEVISRYLRRDEPTHQHYLKERKAQADAIIENSLRPDVEFKNRNKSEPLDAQPSTEIIPRRATGALKEGETLQLIRRDGHVVLAHYFNNQLVAKTPISSDTQVLLTKHYEVAEDV